jgi:hypothetical protein
VTGYRLQVTGKKKEEEEERTTKDTFAQRPVRDRKEGVRDILRKSSRRKKPKNYS